MLLIVQYPSQNVAQLFALVGANPPFLPALGVIPSSLLLQYNVDLPNLNGGQEYYSVAIDTSQHIWVYTPNPAPSGTYGTGVITVYDNAGALIATIAAGTGGMTNPQQIAADPFGNVCTLNFDPNAIGPQYSLSKFNSSGIALSPSGGFPILAGVSQETSLSAFGVMPTIFSIDPSGNVWVACSCYTKFDNNGVNVTATAGFCLDNPFFAGLAISNDEHGNAYLFGDQYGFF